MLAGAARDLVRQWSAARGRRACGSPHSSAGAATRRHGEEHGIGERGTSQITLGVRAAQQQHAEPVGLGGGDHGEFVAGAEQYPQRCVGCGADPGRSDQS